MRFKIQLFVWSLVLCCLAGTAVGGERKTVFHFAPEQNRQPAFDTRDWLLSPEATFDAKDGRIRLAHSHLLCDEMGATDYHQTEPLSERVQAKKIFVLESPEIQSAELLLFGSAKEIYVNGRKVEQNERLPSTGWSRAKIPNLYFKTGTNEIILKGGGHLLVEPSRQPGRSFKSADGGKTWSAEGMTGKETQQGEYVMRLRLGRYAPKGWAISPVLDLWGGGIATPLKLSSVRGLGGLSQGQPEGTRVTTWIRTGSTPAWAAKTWTPWLPLDKDHVVEHEKSVTTGPRWAQLKVELETSRPQASPRLPREFTLEWVQTDTTDGKAGTFTLAPTKGVFHPRIGATPFIYQEPSPRLKLLRERYKLDEVIAPGQTEMEQLMLLRHWVRHQWHTAWGSHPASWMPPWDSLIILESKDQPDCLTMCTHYAAVFTQVCVALGWNARHCILDHHCTAEVYCNQHNKWIMMDAGNSAQRADVNLHFEKDGAPLSALELHRVYHSGKTDGITVHFTPAKLAAKIEHLCRPSPKAKDKYPPRPDVIPLAELPKYPVCQLANYRRYAFPGRNNFLSSLVPGELYQGWSEYFYDGYWWVGDAPDDPKISPEYSKGLSPSRPQDIDWHLNWTRIHLSRTGKAAELLVDLETFTPNLARLERKVVDKAGKETWQVTPATFAWRLDAGTNVLTVRSVNRWDKIGKEAQVSVSTQP